MVPVRTWATRLGGTIVVADPDQETLTIHVAGVPRTLVDRVKALRRDVGYRNGRLASGLPARFGDAELEQWEAALAPRAGSAPAGFVYAVSYLVTAGRRA